MSFRLFGVRVEVHLFFWVTAFLLGFNSRIEPTRPEMGVWIFVVFVSILVHEFGHAAAIMRHGLEAEISLYAMGGRTTWRTLLPLGRIDMIIISLAGPFAGFALAGILYGVSKLAPGLEPRLPMLVREGLGWLIQINLVWGLVNLIPVLPFDGGHVLEQALGPKRVRMTAWISLTIGALITLLCIRFQLIWTAVIFGLGALQSLQRLRSAEPAMPENAVRAAPPPDEMPLEIAALLKTARHALAEEETERALAIAQRVIAGDGGAFTPSPPALVQAFEISTWAHILDGRLDLAGKSLADAERAGEPDAAVSGAYLLARRELPAARRVLEKARSRGDARKEIAGPLIQILLEQGEVGRAAGVAFDIVDSLSDEDTRKMAELAFGGNAFEWSARLFGALFARTHAPEDAYDAARAQAKDGQLDEALEFLRKAVEAGFSDRARAWSDGALEALRSRRLDQVLPPP